MPSHLCNRFLDPSQARLLGLLLLRHFLRYEQSVSPKLQPLARFGLRALRIAASTASIIELLRNDWTGGISAGVAWLVFVQVERRLPPLPADESDP